MFRTGKVVICTPYFNLPSALVRIISRLLRDGKQVEIIIGDKTANDFYIPPEEPFKIIGGLPYLYEINLRRFMQRLQRFSDSEQLTIRLWKDDDNTYHLKGMWVDNQWQLITGNNLNPRAGAWIWKMRSLSVTRNRSCTHSVRKSWPISAPTQPLSAAILSWIISVTIRSRSKTAAPSAPRPS